MDLGALWSLDRQASVLRCVEVWHKESVKVPQFEAVRCEITFMPDRAAGPGLVQA